MSLTDALLLEGYRDPKEVYIALRTDGLKGSGTIDDPFDGSRRNYTDIPISTLSRGGSGNKEATAVTSSDHSFVPGDYVTINGVATTNLADIYYSGTFQVTAVLSTTSFKYQMLEAPFSAQAPGTISCVRERERFDAVMRGVPANSIVHIGAGVFESKGTASGVPTWAPKSGQRILGSGRGVTTLKLVNASWPERDYKLIAYYNYADFIEDFEVSDLTFDCNIAGQPNQLVSCAAVATKGKHIRLRRLRAINFSSQTISYVENFVLAVGSPHPDAGTGKEGVNSVIEDCIVECPGLNSANNDTGFILSSGERPSDGIMAFHRAFAIRNCWYDGTFTDRPVRIASISISAGVATVTTAAPHNRQNGDWVVIAGAVENGSPNTTYNGSYVISNVSTYQFKYSPIAYDGLSLPTTQPTGDMWVDRFSGHRVSVQQLKRNDSDSTVAELTSHGPHNRKPGQWVRLIAVSSPVGTKEYYGRFRIIDGSITAPNVLNYQMASAPSKLIVKDTACTPGDSTCQKDTVFVGVTNQGFSTDGGSESVAEGNRVFGAGPGGSYHDTWGTKSQTDRNNYYSDVSAGPFQNMGGASNPKLGSVSLAGNIATFTTSNPHGFDVGQALRITSSNVTPLTEAFYRVDSVPTSSIFTFDTGGIPLPGSYFGALWQVGMSIKEGNIIELGDTRHVVTDFGNSVGLLYLSTVQPGSQYVIRGLVVRGNVISFAPGSSSSRTQGIQLSSVERAIIENNVINLLSNPPMTVGISQPLHFFNNLNSSGSLIEPLSGTGGDNLTVRIEDAIALAL